MRTIVLMFLLGGVFLGYLSHPTTLHAASDEMFLIRSTAETPEAVVEAVKAYTEQKKWMYLGANKVKKGQVTPTLSRLVEHFLE